jgi:predicted small integral membrane protein
VLAIRLAKIFCIAAIAFYVVLVAFGNITDYWTNFGFVTQVLDMDGVPAASRIHWRAITAPVLHHAGYISIMAAAGLTLGFLLYEGGFVAVGGEWFGMWQAREYDAVQSAFRILMTMLGVLIVSFLGSKPSSSDEQRLEPFFGHRLTP